MAHRPVHAKPLSEKSELARTNVSATVFGTVHDEYKTALRVEASSTDRCAKDRVGVERNMKVPNNIGNKEVAGGEEALRILYSRLFKNRGYGIQRSASQTEKERD